MRSRVARLAALLIAAGLAAGWAALGIGGGSGVGAAISTAAIARLGGHDRLRSIAGALFAAGAALAASWIAREVVGAGYASVRAFAEHPGCAALITILIGGLAFLDHPRRS